MEEPGATGPVLDLGFAFVVSHCARPAPESYNTKTHKSKVPNTVKCAGNSCWMRALDTEQRLERETLSLAHNRHVHERN
jgi:hypothetical protein